MGFENYVEEFGLQVEENPNAAPTDLSGFECSISKGVFFMNRAIVTTMGLDKNPFVVIYTGKQAGAVIFGMKEVLTELIPKRAVKVKVLKTKPTKINIAGLLTKFNLSTNKDYKVDLVDCGEGFIVFSIPLSLPATPKTTSKKEEPKYYGSGIVGAQEMVIEGSDF